MLEQSFHPSLDFLLPRPQPQHGKYFGGLAGALFATFRFVSPALNGYNLCGTDRVCLSCTMERAHRVEGRKDGKPFQIQRNRGLPKPVYISLMSGQSFTELQQRCVDVQSNANVRKHYYPYSV